MGSQIGLQQRIEQLKKAGASLEDVLSRVAKNATLRAVEAAQAATPPKEGTGRGSYIGNNTVTGELKAHWEKDSKTEPQRKGAGYVTELNNNLQYASYVDQGHRLDRHFVPGLYVDESGMLNYDRERNTGIVVGTKTRYVKGEFMADKGKEAYEKTVIAELDKEIERLFR